MLNNKHRVFFNSSRVNVGLIASLVCLALTACGGGSSSTTTTVPVVTGGQPTYTLGGSISNLPVNGLILTDVTDTVAVAANATSITFPTPFSSGAAYTVSIAGQPLGFTDICDLSNASGTFSDANITNVSVLCHAASAVVTTFAGSGIPNSSNGTGILANFYSPTQVAVDTSGNIFVADSTNNLIRKITSAGVVTTLAGSGSIGSANGTGTAAGFNQPFGVAVDSSGNVYVSDTGNSLIRKITSAGVVTTLAGTGSIGNTNGTGTGASFNEPAQLTVDTSGNVYVADVGNNLIRKVTAAGVVTTFAGSGSVGSTNGTGPAASFNEPLGVAVDTSGNVYVADTVNSLIRKITPAGVVTTLAGSGLTGNTNGAGTNASFNNPSGVTVDAAGNVYVADTDNNLIREITPAGIVSTLAGSGNTDNTNGIGTIATFNHPLGVATGSLGSLFVADTINNQIRKITPQ